MTFLKNSHLIGGAISGAIGGITGGTISGIMGGTIDPELTERQVEILNILQNEPTLSISKISQRLKINRSATQEHFEALKSKSIIERIGGTRGYWKINYKK